VGLIYNKKKGGGKMNIGLNVVFDTKPLLENLAKLELNRETITQKITKDFEAIVNDANFQQMESEGSRSGTPYPALSPFTINMRKSKGFPPGPILQETGQLLYDMTHPVQVSITSGSLVVQYEPTIPDQALHQTGGSLFPARPMSDLIQEDVEKIVGLIGTKLVDNLK
jgi:hypothetical protein